VSDRPGNAPAARSLINVVKAGATYDVSLWLTITGAPTAPVNITRAITCEGQPTQYTRLADTTIALEGEWVKLSGELAVPDCTVTGVLIFAEGPPAGVNLYVDDGSVRQRPPEIVNLVTNGDFESGTQGWFSWSGGVIQTATNRAHGGDQSLVVTSRPGNAPAATSVTSAVSPATSYQASFWVSIDGAPAESPEAPVNVTEAITCEGESTQYTRLVDTVIVPEDEWVELVGSLDLPDCPLANVTIYVEGPPADIDLYVDDVVIHP